MLYFEVEMDQDIPFLKGPSVTNILLKTIIIHTLVSILGIDKSQVFKLVAINASNLGECKWGTTFPHVGRTPGWRGHISSLSCFHFSTSILQIELLLHFLLYMFISCLWPSGTRSRVPACFTSPPGVISAVSDFCPLPSFLRGKSPLVQTSPLGRKRRLTHDNSSRSWLSGKRLSGPKSLSSWKLVLH